MSVAGSTQIGGTRRWVRAGPPPPAPGGPLCVGILGARHGSIATALAEGLRGRGHEVNAAADAADREVVLVVAGDTARVVELCRSATSPRLGRSVVAVGEGGVDECISALDAGADDYLRHPFAIAELESRMRALVRRRRPRPPERLERDGLALEPAAMTASRDGVPLELTTGEFRVMEALLRANGRVVGREDLHLALGNTRRSMFASRAVDVCIHGLRGKVDRPFGTSSIDTVRGVGYRLHTG